MLVLPACEGSRSEFIDEEFIASIVGVLSNQVLRNKTDLVSDFHHRSNGQGVVACNDMGSFPGRNQSINCTGLLVVREEPFDWKRELTRVVKKHTMRAPMGLRRKTFY